LLKFKFSDKCLQIKIKIILFKNKKNNSNSRVEPMFSFSKKCHARTGKKLPPNPLSINEFDQKELVRLKFIDGVNHNPS